jgi:DNA modification methylase
MISTNTILQGDALSTLKSFPDCCIQMCGTSPPYYGIRDYGVSGQIGMEETPEDFISNKAAHRYGPAPAVCLRGPAGRDSACCKKKEDLS